MFSPACNRAAVARATTKCNKNGCENAYNGNGGVGLGPQLMTGDDLKRHDQMPPYCGLA